MEIKNDYKDEFNSEMPSSTWRGWKTLFIKGCILPCPIWSDDLPPEHPRSDPNEIFAKVQITIPLPASSYLLLCSSVKFQLQF